MVAAASAPTVRPFSVAEYLREEARMGERHEFRNGKITNMAGGSIPHNRISTNIVGELHAFFKSKKGFQLFGSDQKIYLPKLHFYLYPDAVVVAETPMLSDKIANAIINPLLIVEVLSDSTERYDRGQKFIEYRSLPSFKEYVLVRQDAPEILTFFREKPNVWIENEVEGIENEVHFQSIGLRLGLELIYRNIEF